MTKGAPKHKRSSPARGRSSKPAEGTTMAKDKKDNKDKAEEVSVSEGDSAEEGEIPEEERSGRRRLTPMRNSEVGALIPVANKGTTSSAASVASSSSFAADCGRLSEEDEWVVVVERACWTCALFWY